MALVGLHKTLDVFGMISRALHSHRCLAWIDFSSGYRVIKVHGHTAVPNQVPERIQLRNIGADPCLRVIDFIN